MHLQHNSPRIPYVPKPPECVGAKPKLMSSLHRSPNPTIVR